VGAIGGLNQIEVKLLLTYSSIAHSAWILALVSVSSLSWRFYFMIYSILLIPIITTFFSTNIIKITEINKTKIPVIEKNILTFLILSLGGLPPFLGFTAKLTAIIILIKTFPLIILIILISSSLVSLFFYLKIFYNLAATSSIETKINQTKFKSTTLKLITVALTGNLIISSIVLLI
jgi:NADH:ubiquinone oxidoreductase subunit 2 (subunit N)